MFDTEEVVELRARIESLERQAEDNKELYEAFHISVKVANFVFTRLPKAVAWLGKVLVAIVVIYECWMMWHTGIIPRAFINLS